MNQGIRPGSAFRQANLMVAAIAAIAASCANNTASMKAQIAALGPYQGRGKGRTRNHDQGGTKAFQRLAKKKRNQARHRKACRG